MADDDLEWVPCRGCGAKMVFLRSESSGSSIPAQPIRTLYRLRPALIGEPTLEIVDGPPDMFVSHFETCPHASDFSRGKKKP